MSDLVAWLTQILDAREWWANSPTPPGDHDIASEKRHALADIAAKRAIIALHEGGVSYPEDCGLCNEGMPCQTVRLLASAYADRPGYDESWRP